jgi:hypothetical protein
MTQNALSAQSNGFTASQGRQKPVYFEVEKGCMSSEFTDYRLLANIDVVVVDVGVIVLQGRAWWLRRNNAPRNQSNESQPDEWNVS